MTRLTTWILATAVVAVGALAAPPARADGKNEIRAVSYDDTGGTTRVIVRGATTPTFTVYKLERPSRVVLDVPSARLAEALKGHESAATFAPNTWAVSTIAAQQLDDGGQIVRVIVTLARPGRYDVKTENNAVVIMVTARDPAPATSNPAELAKLQKQHEAAQAEAHKAQAEAHKAKAEAERLRKIAADAQRAADDAKRDGQQANAAARARAEQAAARANQAAQAAQIEAERARNAAETAKRDALAEAERAKAAMQHARAEAEVAKQDVAKSRAELARTKQEAEAARVAAMRETEAAKSEARVAKEQAARETEAVRAAAQREAQAARDAAKREAEAARADLARAKAEADKARREAEAAKQQAAMAESRAHAELEKARREAELATSNAARMQSEAEKARREAEAAKREAASSKAMTKAESERLRRAAELAAQTAARTQAEAEKARREADTAKQEAAAIAARTKAELDTATARARAEAADARRQAEAAQRLAEVARRDATAKQAEIDAIKTEAARARDEARSARADAETARQAAATEKKRAEAARAEAERVLREAKDRIGELDRKTREAQAMEDRARAANAAAQAREEAARETALRATREREQAEIAVKRATEAAAKASAQERERMLAEAKAAEAKLAAARRATEQAEQSRRAAETAAHAAKQQLEQTRSTLATVEQQRTAAATAATEAARKRGEAEAAASAASRRRSEAEVAAERAAQQRDEAERAAKTAAKQRSEAEQQRIFAEQQKKAAERAAREAKLAADAAERQRVVAEQAARVASDKRETLEASVAELGAKKQAAERAAAELEARSKAEAKAQAAVAAARARKASEDELAKARVEASRLADERKRAESDLADRRKAVAQQQAETARLQSAAAQARDAASREEARRTELAAQRAREEQELARIKQQKAVATGAAAPPSTPMASAPTPAPIMKASMPATSAATWIARLRQRPRPAPAPTIKPVITPAPIALAKITDIRFKGSDSYGQIDIAIVGEGTVTAGDSSAQYAELIIDRADLATKLERKLDVSKFGSPVRSVSSYRDRRAPHRVRLVVELAVPAKGTFDLGTGTITWKLANAGPQQVAHKQPRPARVANVQNVPSPVVGGFGAASTPIAQQSVAQLPAQGGRNRRIYRGQTIDLDFKDAPIHDLLRALSDVGKVSIVVPESVNPKVTVRLKKVPWDQALEVILASHGLWYRRDGQIIRVADRKELDKEDEAEAARRRAMVEAESPRVETVGLNYASAAELKPKLESMLSGRPGSSIQVDERTNQLIINDIAGNREQIARLALQLDTQTPQIQIEARIVEARSTFLRQFGIQWGGRAVASAAGGNATGLVFPSSVSLIGGNEDAQTIRSGVATPSDFAINLPAATGSGEGGAIGLSLGSVGGNFNINLRLSALEDTGTIRIISAPKITVLNNKQAKISQGVSIPISVVSANGTTTQFVQADLSLDVTPYVSQRDCAIAMNINVTKNEPDFVNVGARGDPTILRKEARTTMLVQNGETSVLGGIYTRNSGLAYKKFPFLGDLPVLGWLFKNRRENDDRTEILVFITPKITNKAALRCE